MSEATLRAVSEDIGAADALVGRIPSHQLDTTHGVVLYLEGISVSFDGFKALNLSRLRSTRASCAA